MLIDKKRLLNFILQKNNYRLILIFLCSICLLFILGNIKNKDTQKIKIADQQYSQDGSDYVASTEKRLTDILSGIDGVGKVSVMITLEGGSEYIFAQDSKVQKNSQKEENRLSSEEQTEIKPLIIKGNNGEEAILLCQIEPKVKGVVVVCEGGNISSVREGVVSSVKALLGISSNKIYVTKMKG